MQSLFNDEVAGRKRCTGARHDRQEQQSAADVGIYPRYAAPIVARLPDGSREMFDARWGLPSSRKALMDAASKRADKLRVKGQEIDQARFAELLRMKPDKGTTNVRNIASQHWKRWLGPENRCLVPATSFSAPDQVQGTLKPIWYALSEHRPPFFFAGIWVPERTSVRTMKEGEVTADCFGFLTTEANVEVARHHSKAMPVILTTEAEPDLWMSDALWSEVAQLQRPLSDGTLKIVGMGAGKGETVPV